MVKDRRGACPTDRPCASAFLAATLGASLFRPTRGGRSDSPRRRSRGAFNVGDARGNVGLVAEPEPGGDVLKLDYSLPPGTAVGVWTKGFPAGLARGLWTSSAASGSRPAIDWQ